MLKRYQLILMTIVILLLVQTQMISAQNLLTFDYTAFAQSRLANDPPDPFLENLEVDVSRLDFGARYSFQLYSDRTTVTKGVNFSLLNFTFINWNEAAREYRPDKMYGLSYELTIRQKVSPNWYLVVQALPGIYSEFHDLRDDDFRMQGAIKLGNKPGSAFDYGLGVAYLDILGESDWWPSIYLLWHPNPTNTILIDFPHQAEYNYQFLDGLEFGMLAELKGNRYHIDDRAVNRSYENNSVQYSTGLVGLYSKIRVTGNFFGTFQFGYTFRKFLEINDTEWRDPDEFNTKNNFLIKLSLELRPIGRSAY